MEVFLQDIGSRKCPQMQEANFKVLVGWWIVIFLEQDGWMWEKWRIWKWLKGKYSELHITNVEHVHNPKSGFVTYITSNLLRMLDVISDFSSTIDLDKILIWCMCSRQLKLLTCITSRLCASALLLATVLTLWPLWTTTEQNFHIILLFFSPPWHVCLFHTYKDTNTF